MYENPLCPGEIRLNLPSYVQGTGAFYGPDAHPDVLEEDMLWLHWDGKGLDIGWEDGYYTIYHYNGGDYANHLWTFVTPHVTLAIEQIESLFRTR